MAPRDHARIKTAYKGKSPPGWYKMTEPSGVILDTKPL